MFKTYSNSKLIKLMCYIPGLPAFGSVAYNTYEENVKTQIKEKNLKPETIKAISLELTELSQEAIVMGDVRFMNIDIEYHYLLGSAIKTSIYCALYWFYSSRTNFDVGVVIAAAYFYLDSCESFLDTTNKQHKRIITLINSEEICERISQ